MAFTYGTVWGDWGDEKVQGTTKLHPVGTRMVLPDGRVYYYASNSTTEIGTAGQVVDGRAAEGNHDMDLAPTATQSVGDRTVSLEVPTTDLKLNEYADGYLIFNDATGEGEVYRIASHPAHDASDDNTAVFTLDEGNGIRSAITTSTEAQLIFNPYTEIKIIDGDGAQGTGPLGVSTVLVNASTSAIPNYCWIQTAGIASVWSGGTRAEVGNEMEVSESSAESGKAGLQDSSGATDLPSIGTAMSVQSILTDYQVIMLNIRN
jgi:hypothetical protein